MLPVLLGCVDTPMGFRRVSEGYVVDDLPCAPILYQLLFQ